MTEVFGRFSGPAFALLRIVAGLMFLMHGTQKIFGMPPMEMKGPLPPIALAAGWIEVVCGALIVIGLFGGLAAFIASGEMAVAYFVGHASHGGPTPLQNKGELAVLYCFVWLFVAAHGSGIWSLDSILRKRTPVTS
jgi:putative oxidoreductase